MKKIRVLQFPIGNAAGGRTQHTSEKLVTVIIPIYNTDNYIGRCLDSILSQTLKEIEIICVDDGSTDNSLKICQNYAARDNRIKVLHRENGGPGAAKNMGLQHASAEYIIFADSDDWVEPEMYETLYLQAIACNADISVTGYTKDTDNVSEKMVNKQKIEKDIFGSEDLIRYAFIRDEYKNFGAYVVNKLFKRKLILEKGKEIFFDEKLTRGEDVYFYTCAALKAQNAVYSDKCMYHYVQRKESYTHAMSLKNGEGMLRTYEMVIKACTENNITEDTLNWIRRFYVYHASLLAERAIECKKIDKLEEYKACMRKHLKVYLETNKQYPERVERMERLLNYGQATNNQCNCTGV